MMIRRALQTRFLPVLRRHLFSSSPVRNNKSCNFRLLAPSTRFQLTSLFSTLPSAPNPNSPSDESASAQLQEGQETSSPDLVEDVSTEELKKLIQNYDNGDEDAIPSILEAILKRKLSGMHEESDEELMNELGIKIPKYLSDIGSEDDTEDFTDDEDSL